jgi:hypothetical protein
MFCKQISPKYSRRFLHTKKFIDTLSQTFKYGFEWNQRKVLDLYDKSFFGPDTLDFLYDVKLSGKIFNEYFGHIPLYSLLIRSKKDNKRWRIIVWDIKRYHEWDDIDIEFTVPFKVIDTYSVKINGNYLDMYESRC